MTKEKPTSGSIEAQIVENLRKVYNNTVEEEVPDRFLDLLRQLKETDGSDETGGDA